MAPSPKVRLEAAGRAEAFRQMEGQGLRPISLAERAANSAAKNSAPTGAKGGGVFAQVRRQQNLRARSRKFHPPALQPARGRRAVEPRAGHLAQRSVVPSRRREVEGDSLTSSLTACHFADAMAKSPETFPRVYVAMVQAGETGGFLDLVLAQMRGLPGPRKRSARQSHDRDALSDDPAHPCAGCRGVPARVLHSEVPDDLLRLRRFVAGADPGHHRNEPCAAVVWLVCARRPVRPRIFAAGLVQLGERSAGLGRLHLARPGRRPAGRAVRHGALLPHARHAARRGREPGSSLERRAQIPSATRFWWTRFPPPSRAFPKARNWAKASPTVATCSPAQCWK